MNDQPKGAEETFKKYCRWNIYPEKECDEIKLAMEVYAAERIASLEAEIKQLEFEATERRADLQDLETENKEFFNKNESLKAQYDNLKEAYCRIEDRAGLYERETDRYMKLWLTEQSQLTAANQRNEKLVEALEKITRTDEEMIEDSFYSILKIANAALTLNAQK